VDEGWDLVIFLAVICHTPIPDALNMKFSDAVKIQERFITIVQDILTSVGSTATAKDLVKTLHFLPPPEAWVALKEAQR
jgi:hypothetical protein